MCNQSLDWNANVSQKRGIQLDGNIIHSHIKWESHSPTCVHLAWPENDPFFIFRYLMGGIVEAFDVYTC